MRVDEAGCYPFIGAVNDFGTSWYAQVLSNLCDSGALDEHVGLEGARLVVSIVCGYCATLQQIGSHVRT